MSYPDNFNSLAFDNAWGRNSQDRYMVDDLNSIELFKGIVKNIIEERDLSLKHNIADSVMKDSIKSRMATLRSIIQWANSNSVRQWLLEDFNGFELADVWDDLRTEGTGYYESLMEKIVDCPSDFGYEEA